MINTLAGGDDLAKLAEITLTSFPGIWQAVTPADMPPGRYDEIEREVDGWSLDDALVYAHASPARG